MLNKRQAVEAVQAMLDTHAAERKQFDEIAAYLRPWSASEAAERVGASLDSKNRDKHADIARMAQSPFIGLVLDTYGQSLKVDGFYTSDAEEAGSWEWWQRNRMKARQTGLHRAALQYGTSYATALPANDGQAVRIGVHSPRRMVAYYGGQIGLPGSAAVTDEFPILAMEIDRRHIRLYDENHVYFFGIQNKPEFPSQWLERAFHTEGNLPFIESREHGLEVTPVVRYQDRMMADGEEQFGIVSHLLGMQDRINRTNYEQGVAQYFAAFKQRYIIGWMPESEIEAMRQSVSDTQFFDDPDVKVGQYDETDLTRYIESRQASVRDFAAVAQVPAQALGANAISNISAEGLASLETSKDRKASEIQASLGESHEQLLRLCSYIVGDEEGAADFGAEIRWAETSARSFAQTVDGLGKLATMLGVPAEELWQDIPGWTKERVDHARKSRAAGQFGGGEGLFFDDIPEPESNLSDEGPVT